jgi:filamentous hemagglutinin family protein
MQTRSTLQSRRAGCAPDVRPFARSPVAIAVAAALGIGVHATVFADPTGGVVVAGQGAISTPNAGTTIIDQSSQQLDLNWDSFNVGANESVKFNQPSSSAVAVNRILDQNPSQIFGRIDANGKVVLVNPNGLLIGRTAQLNVGSLVASSLEAIDFDSASGRYRFSTSRGETGAVTNEGSITAVAGGSVTLLGGRVTNTGSILADFGTVNLAAGRAATIDLAGDGLLRLEVGSDLLVNSSGAASAVENSGTIQSNGGRVLLTAGAMESVFTNLVNNTGVVRANRIDDTGGTIQLVGPEGMVLSSGTLDASAGDDVSTGGSVAMLGDRVGLLGNAVVDVSGATGGGTVLIGGDYQGSNPDIINATRTFVSAGSTIDADAGTQGDGGHIIIWSNDSTRYDGSLSARGGTLWGNGGFAEVSGKHNLGFNGTALLAASHGTWGSLLLDPENIRIDSSNAAPPDLNNGGDGNYLVTDDPGQSVTIGNLTIRNLLGTVGNVTLRADNSITQDAGADIDVQGDSSALYRSLGLYAGIGGITLNGRILTNNGDVTLDTSGNIAMGGGSAIDSGFGTVTLTGQDVTVTSIATVGIVRIVPARSLFNDGDVNTRISADQLFVTANSGAIGASSAAGAIDTNVNSLILQAHGGGVYVREQDGLSAVDAVSDVGSVAVTALFGDITFSSAKGATGVTIDALTGSIFDTGFGLGVNGGSGPIVLHALRDIGTITNYSQRLGTPIRIFGGGGFSAKVENPFGHINVSIPNLAVVGLGGIRVGDGNYSAGQVLLQSQGFLFTDQFADGAFNLGTFNDSQVTLSAGVAGGADSWLNLKSSGSLFSSAPGELTLHGGDITDMDGSPNTINVNARGLRYESSAPLADKILNSTAYRLDVHLGSARNFTLNQTGDVLLGTIDVSGGNVTMTASGGSGLFDDMDDSTAIIGNSVTLTGGLVGVSGNELDTRATTLTLNSPYAGVYVREADDVTLLSATAAASLDVRTLNGVMSVGSASGLGVTLATGGTAGRDLTLTGSINGNGRDVTLTAGGGTGGHIINQASTPITGDTLTVSGATIGVLGGVLRTDMNRIVSTSTVGATTIVEANDLASLNASSAGALDVRTMNGAMTVTSASGTAGVTLTSDGANNNLTVNGAVNGGTGDVALVASGDNAGITLNSTVATSGDVSLTAGSSTARGAITGGASHSVSGTNVTAVGGSIGTSASRLKTNTEALNATSTNGAIYIQEATSAQLNASATGGTVDVATTNGTLSAGSVSGNNVTLTAGGALSAIAIDGLVDGGAGGTVTLTAGGDIAQLFTGGRVVADTLNATGSQIGSSSSALATTVATLNTTSTNGSTFIAEADDASLTASATGGMVVVDTTNGVLTVDSVSSVGTGSAVWLTSGGAGNGINLNGAIATPGDVHINAGYYADRGALVVGSGGSIAGDDLVIAAASIGSSSGPLMTNVTSLEAQSTTGDIYVREADDLTVTSVLAAGAVDLGTTNGAMNVTNVYGADVTLATGGAGHDITLGTITSSGGAVVLSAGGAIAATSGGTVIGNSLTASGTAIGSADSRLLTSVASLDTTSSDGGTFITNAYGTTLNANVTNGALDILTTSGPLTATVNRSGTGGGVRLVTGETGSVLSVNSAIDGGDGDVFLEGSGAGAAVTLNGSVTTTGNVTIAAGTPTGRGALSVANGSVIAGDAVSIAARSIGTSSSAVRTSANILDATAGNGGIFVQETDGLLLNANATNGSVKVETLDGALTVEGASGRNITLTSGGAGNGIAVNGRVTTPGVAVLNAGGAITAGASGEIAADFLDVVASSIGTSTERLNTNVAGLNATTTNGGMFITEMDGLMLTANATGGAVDVRAIGGPLSAMSATGDGVTLGAGEELRINGNVDGRAGLVSLTANGAIVADPGTQVSGDTLLVGGISVGSADARLNTKVATLIAQSVGGNIYVTEADDVMLTGNALGGSLDVQTTNGVLSVSSANGDGVTLVANGAGKALDINGMVNSAGGDISLRANGANSEIRLAGTVVTPGNVSMMAGTSSSRGAVVASDGGGVIANTFTVEGASIGSSASALVTAVTSLDATSRSGDIYVSDVDDLSLRASAHDGGLNVRSLNGALTVTQASGELGVILATDGDGQGITLNGLVDGGLGGVGLFAGSSEEGGAIVAGAGAEVRGSVLTATGASIGSAATRLHTNVDWVNGTATNGGVYIDELNGLSNVNVTASGGAAGDVEVLTATGDLGVRNVRATDTVLLAAGGNITASMGSVGVNARAAELRAGAGGAGQIGTAGNPLSLALAAGDMLRIYSNSVPAITRSTGVSGTLSPFDAPSADAMKVGFGQFTGGNSTSLDPTTPTDPTPPTDPTNPTDPTDPTTPEGPTDSAIVRAIRNEPSATQGVFREDRAPADPDVRLLEIDKQGSPLCLPPDQRRDESTDTGC